MKKTFLWLLCAGSLFLTACGDDDPVIPVLNKLTKVSCYKEGVAAALFTADINYTADGKISNMRFSGDRNLLFIYSDGKFTVTDVASGTTTAEYTLNGDVIVAKRVQKLNPKASNEIYVSDEYTYRYMGSSLSQVSWIARWPKEVGVGYEERSYPEYERFTWENGNVVLFAQAQDSREMRYEYSLAEAPLNFPLRVVGSFAPVDFEAVTPLNLLYGARNRNLPTRAYTYTVPNPSVVNAEYTYHYTMVGDYITAMTIEEEKEGEQNTYKYSFEYNFEEK